ncbi:MAG: monovalent cation/H(+) antiporter subunit G [Alphaproteobacteria bacterium]|jgi:multicomponent Na+:H+ antiporter subunit G|nr:monovalent cation/H(+) antiporter subunit G [Alphaproteobacteria bacterium]MBT4020718.1 monovalent cation/H(+) antiporter subunit G [Alphaproteobacteria bacterium]MBT4965166.1 monovalent cation/H(+) antiporter subunit G [Alphaproteobacteria bacterium]MBT5159651.1 monovalent cation/H(+) antiporter subunit G [Alphaproteobacteria bacterium]MBT5917616.1 monovalent cation/H(+) antiporter subunit G [Alphaproteobacteria bacterium]
MMNMALDVLSWILLLGGGFFVFVGGLGLFRMPDFYTRVHAASLTDTMGAGMILIGLMLQAGWTLNSGKLMMILVFIFFTSPTSTHALAKAALFAGARPLIARREKSKEKNKLPDSDKEDAPS